MSLSIPYRALACLLSFAFIPSFTLLAADPATSRTVTLAECLRRVAERNPELKAGVYKTEAAENRAKQAARRLNPRLQTEIETVAGSGEAEGLKAAESTVSLSQEIELGDKRRHRTAAAQADAAVSRAEEGGWRAGADPHFTDEVAGQIAGVIARLGLAYLIQRLDSQSDQRNQPDSEKHQADHRLDDEGACL